jgi:transposase
MPWKECSVMDERLRFVAQLLDGEAMSEVCRAFGISRKTGYKIFERYKEHGLEALTDRSRRPVRYANQRQQLAVDNDDCAVEAARAFVNLHRRPTARGSL